jgi:hypothetical protein
MSDDSAAFLNEPQGSAGYLWSDLEITPACC